MCVSLLCIWQPNTIEIEAFQNTKIESHQQQQKSTIIFLMVMVTQNSIALIICHITNVGSINFMRFNILCSAYKW